MRINIVFVGPFPIGMAATNRLTSYARGFIKQGIEVKLYLLRGSEKHKRVVNQHKSGLHKGIDFEYLTSNIAPNYQILKLFWAVIGILRCLYVIRKNEIVIFHAVDKASILLAYLLRIFKRNQLFWVRDEKPVILEKSFWRYTVDVTFQGFILMTKEIEIYVNKLLPKKKAFILPITVDFDRFNIPDKSNFLEYKDYFCHIGLNNPNRDGFELLVQAFLHYKSLYNTNEYLLCIGDFNNPDVQGIIEKYKHYPSFSSIVFLGKHSGVELIAFMKNALALITTPVRIDSLGFPSKLAEYLASKRPVITTNVGEISTFLTESSAVLCHPKIDDISAAFYFVSTNQQIANSIGQQGYLVARQHFNIDIHIVELIKYLYE